MTSADIRQRFLNFFQERDHKVLPSSSLIAFGDPTLLFTSAGMVQFKPYFLGQSKPPYPRATTCQKVFRSVDIDIVGHDGHHLTFFEMLGNFSFGDYFKEKAIPYAWELITSPEWFAIPKDKLYVTIFGGAEVAPGTTLGVDEDARKIWLAQNVPAERIVPIPGLKENFWAMGDTGPCGPCSEIHYDLGPAASEQGHTDCAFPCDCGRYVELWNLVFMQYNRDESGALTPLPRPSIDTGAGLERLTTVLQGKTSNFDTDLFKPLILNAGWLTIHGESLPISPKEHDASLRII